MDINIKGGGLTRTVKADCPEFPIQLGEKVSDQEVRNLDLIFTNNAIRYSTTDVAPKYPTDPNNKYAYDTGLSLFNIHNTTSNTYLVFYNITMKHISPENQPNNLPQDQWPWAYYTAGGAFMILPYQLMSINDTQSPLPLLTPGIMDFPYTKDLWSIKDGTYEFNGEPIENNLLQGDMVLPHVKVYKLK